ncbi:phage head-tail joining protein [Kerstersia similis]|uniref:phage head-tail joining protein n=1 Tax=Kerstersia similis TaxID=206505 RepID=UPI0039EF97C0
MAYTQQDLIATERAIAASELEVQYGDKRVRYRSMDELLAAKRVIEADLRRQAGMPSRRITKLRHGGKGV